MVFLSIVSNVSTWVLSTAEIIKKITPHPPEFNFIFRPRNRKAEKKNNSKIYDAPRIWVVLCRCRCQWQALIGFIWHQLLCEFVHHAIVSSSPLNSFPLFSFSSKLFRYSQAHTKWPGNTFITNGLPVSWFRVSFRLLRSNRLSSTRLVF